MNDGFYGHDFAESPENYAENYRFYVDKNLVYPLIAYRVICRCLYVDLCLYEAEKYIIKARCDRGVVDRNAPGAMGFQTSPDRRAVISRL